MEYPHRRSPGVARCAANPGLDAAIPSGLFFCVIEFATFHSFAGP